MTTATDETTNVSERVKNALASNQFLTFDPKKDVFLKPVRSTRPWVYTTLIQDRKVFVLFVTYSEVDDLATMRMYVLDTPEYMRNRMVDLDQLSPNFEGEVVLQMLERRADGD